MKAPLYQLNIIWRNGSLTAPRSLWRDIVNLLRLMFKTRPPGAIGFGQRRHIKDRPLHQRAWQVLKEILTKLFRSTKTVGDAIS